MVKPLRAVLKADIRVEVDPVYGGNLFVQESPGLTQLAIPVPKGFKDGEKVRVTVERLED